MPAVPDRGTPPVFPAAHHLGTAIRIGLVLFGLGVIAVLVDVIPFFFGVHDRPLWLNLACLLVPLGLVIAVWAALARGRADQKRTLREAEQLAARRAAPWQT